MHILMYRWKAYNYRDIEQTFYYWGIRWIISNSILAIMISIRNLKKYIENKTSGKRHYDMVFTVQLFVTDLEMSARKIGE